MDAFDIKKLNLRQKISLTHGNGAWHTASVEGLPSLTLTDGPHGLRKQADKNRGVNDSERATCFPTACAVASSWNRNVAAQVGKAIAEEAVALNVDVVLGPGINIKRSPLCGRNFEYFSEDPLLAGELATSYVNAMQSVGVGCSVKHFAVNSQETRRMTVNAVVDERALREIYLSAFENVVKNARPYTVMASYNKINGVSATQNGYLYKVLRNEWGFDGLVMSDWGAAYDNGAAFSAGLDLEMPDGGKFHEFLTETAVKEGRLSESDLDRACQNVVNLVNKCKRPKTEPSVDYMSAHDKIALQAAVESAVLLKNDGGVLPITDKSKILVVGELAKKPRYQGAGSSHVNAVCRNFLDILTDNGVDYDYKKGYSVKGDEPNVKLEEQAVEDCCKYDFILFFGGLTDDFEGEGYDRTVMEIPFCQQRLLKRLHSVNQNIIFVGFGGSPYSMPWLDKTKALLNMYLGGQAVMQAAYDLIFGKANPCGRLAETFPAALTDTPSYNYFANDRYLDEHRESLFVGYRYYNSYGVKTRFPFGYGLSYTKFSYDGFTVSETESGYEAEVTVTNCGDVDGSEVVQIYVDNCDCGLLRAKRELRAFDKVFLKAGQSVRVKLPLNERSFSVFYNGRWTPVAGKYSVCVCSDVETVLLSKQISVKGESIVGCDKKLYPSYYADVVGSFSVTGDDFYRLANQAERQTELPKRGEFTLLNTLEDMQSVKLVRLVKKLACKVAKKQAPSKTFADPVAQMIYRGATETPLISLMSVGGIPAHWVLFMLHHANRRHAKAFKAFFGSAKL